MRTRTVSLFAAALAGLVFSGAAQSADLQRKVPARAATAAPYNWGGFYIGGHGGYGWGSARWTNTASNANAGPWPDLIPGNTTSHDIKGWVGGGQIGYNVQSGAWVFGVEASGSGAGIRGSSISGPGPFSAQDDTFTTKIRALLLAGARVGYASGSWLTYVKGGYAGASIRATAVDVIGPSIGRGADTNWHNGWNAGAGLEFGVWQNASFAVQYDYIRLGTDSHNLSGGPGIYVWDVAPRNTHLVTGRLNWRLGGGPVVARY